MVRTVIAILAGAILVVAVTGCSVAVVETPDPAAIPSGEPVAQGEEPTGPIVELTADRVSGIGWRLVMYESAAGQCLQFETVAVAETGCGDLLPDEGSAFGGVSAGGEGTDLRPVYGIVGPEIAGVVLIDDATQNRVPAKLLPLDEAGLDARAFIGFQPDGLTITHLQALLMSGEVVDTYELP